MKASLVESGRERSARGVKWLVLARLMVILLCICVLLIRTMAQPESAFRLSSVFLLLISLAVLNVGYLLILPFLRSALLPFVLLQFLLDITAETGLIFLTGGVQSNFVNLYFVSIMASSMLLSRRLSGLFASLATLGLAIVNTLYVTGIGMHLVDPIYHLRAGTGVGPVLAWMLLIVLAIFVVAFLSGLLSERLELARSLNEEILPNMAEGLAVFDLSNRLVFFNREFAAVFSPQRQLQLGDSVEQVFAHAEDEPLQRIISSRTATRFELEKREEAGTIRPPLEVRTSCLGQPENLRGMVMLAIDLSLLHRVEQAELQAERFAAVSEMAAALAHEIRNPLATVRGSIQEISRDFVPDSPNHRLAAIVIRESDRLNEIITNFLQYARQRSLRPKNSRLSALLEEVQTMLQKRGDAAEITINAELGDDPWVRCDPEQIREVFLNIGVNAVAAISGKGTITIRCPHPGARPPGTSVIRKNNDAGVTVSITDTGRGLPPGTEGKIFEPFYTTKPRGSGLGLSSAKRVVEAHEGRIWVESQPGEGATFFVWLPRSGPFKSGAPDAGTNSIATA